MSSVRSLILAALMSSGIALPAAAQSCGGDLGVFLEGVKAEAVAKGIPADVADRALSGARVDQKVLSRDRAQGVFKQTFLEFSQRTVSKARLDIGSQKIKQYADIFQRAEQEFGVPPGVIAAFWAMETDFGVVQGDFNTRDALVTLAHDCRRPELFRPQLLALIEMVQHGDLDPATNTGAWAGEIGQVQMLPEDIIAYGVDGDGDGHVNVKQSSPDAILTAAKFIQSLGFRRGEPWIQEVTLPADLPWEKTGLGNEVPASDWFAMGVQPRDGKYRVRLPACGTGPAAGAQWPGVSDLPELQHLSRVESVVHLHHLGGLFRHAADGRANLPEGQSRSGTGRRGDEGPSDQAAVPRARCRQG